MTDANHCAQNALAECMNGRLKRELMLGAVFPSFGVAKSVVNDAIFTYNNIRGHGELKGKTPAEIHSGNSGAIELWLKELVAFSMPIPKAAKFSVNSI